MTNANVIKRLTMSPNFLQGSILEPRYSKIGAYKSV